MIAARTPIYEDTAETINVATGQFAKNIRRSKSVYCDVGNNDSVKNMEKDVD